MIPALINLVVVLVVAAVLYWALGKLWPLTGAFGTSTIGQIVYVLLIVIGVLAIVFWGVIPVIQSLAGVASGSRTFLR
jgi:hypothetical protein